VKAIYWIFIVAFLLWSGWKIKDYWANVNRRQKDAELEKPMLLSEIVPQSLPGMRWELENSFEAAKLAGAGALKRWLDKYRPLNLIQDPRLAWVELDYVLLVSQSDPAEARRVFAEVKRRTPPDSPVMLRIRALEKTYE
jgi:hypothetical protein